MRLGRDQVLGSSLLQQQVGGRNEYPRQRNPTFGAKKPVKRPRPPPGISRYHPNNKGNLSRMICIPATYRLSLYATSSPVLSTRILEIGVKLGICGRGLRHSFERTQTARRHQSRELPKRPHAVETLVYRPASLLSRSERTITSD